MMVASALEPLEPPPPQLLPPQAPAARMSAAVPSARPARLCALRMEVLLPMEMSARSQYEPPLNGNDRGPPRPDRYLGRTNWSEQDGHASRSEQDRHEGADLAEAH